MRNIYTPQQKQQCCKAYGQGIPVHELSKKFNIPRSTIYTWIKQAQGDVTKTELNWKTFRQKERKIQRLESIIEILHNVDFFTKVPLKLKLDIFETLHGKYSAHIISEALLVPRGTFYNHILRNKRDHTFYAKRREELREKIQTIYDENRQVFGAGKITAVLKNKGEKVSEPTVRRLMQDMGLISIREGAKDQYDKEQLSHKNYLNQQFDVARPNEVWVSDVTYFRFNNHNYYICVIIDLYARRVIAHRIGLRNSTQLAKSTFKLAYENRKPTKPLLFHTDRGTNYRAYAFRNYLKCLSVKQSFSRAYVPYDNSVMESFFASLKREELYRTKYRSEKEFRRAVKNYITFYNDRRPHKKNGYKTPKQREQDSFSK